MRILALLLFLPVLAWAEPIQVEPLGTKTISCTSTTGATALTRPDADNRRQVELSNAGAVTIFVEFGASTVTAAVASGYPILAGQTKVVTVNRTTSHIACIVAVTTTTLYASVGVGE